MILTAQKEGFQNKRSDTLFQHTCGCSSSFYKHASSFKVLKSHIMNIACELCAHYSLYGIVRHLSCGPRHLNLLQCVCVCAMTSISGTGNKVVGTFFFHLSLIIIISIINLFLCLFVCVCERVFSVFHSLCNRTFHLADSLIILNHPTDG